MPPTAERESVIGEEKNQRSRKYVLNFVHEITLKKGENQNLLNLPMMC